MAQVGLKSFLFAPIGEAGAYDTPAKLAGAIEFKEALDTNDAKLYSDDVLQESDSSVSGGTLTMGVDDDPDAVFCPLLGKKSSTVTIGSSEDAETVTVYTSNTNDEAKHFGFGYISRKTGGKFKVNFYPEVSFKPYSIDGKTKGEKLEYTTPSVEGTLYPNADGDYKKEATVDSEVTAVALLKKFFGVTDAQA